MKTENIREDLKAISWMLQLGELERLEFSTNSIKDCLKKLSKTKKEGIDDDEYCASSSNIIEIQEPSSFK